MGECPKLEDRATCTQYAYLTRTWSRKGHSSDPNHLRGSPDVHSKVHSSDPQEGTLALGS